MLIRTNGQPTNRAANSKVNQKGRMVKATQSGMGGVVAGGIQRENFRMLSDCDPKDVEGSLWEPFFPVALSNRQCKFEHIAPNSLLVDSVPSGL